MRAKRRGKGDGSILIEPNGRFRAVVTIQHRRVSKTFATKEECRLWMRQLLSQVDRGYRITEGRMSVQEYAGQWLVRQGDRLRPQSLIDYQRCIQKYLLPHLGHMRLCDLEGVQIQQLYDHLKELGVSDRMRFSLHQVLHKMLGDAVMQRVLAANPADAVVRPRYFHQEMQILDEAQVSQLLLAARESRLEVLYRIAAKYGLRQAELLGLRWSDLDWKRGTLRVQRQAKHLKGQGWTFPEPKTRSGRRSLQLGELTLQALRVHRERQEAEKKRAGQYWQEYGLIFPSDVGTPIDARNLLKNYKTLLERAGLPAIRFHDLRHTAASLMLTNHIPVLVVSKILGHAKPSTTLDLYGHLVADGQQQAARIIDELGTPIPVEIQPVQTQHQAGVENPARGEKNDKHG
jgi:integrase